MGLSVEARSRGLRHVFSGRLRLGLASRLEDGALFECSDRNYERQEIAFDEPKQRGDAVEIASAARIAFEPFYGDVKDALRWWFVADAKKSADFVGRLQPAAREV